MSDDERSAKSNWNWYFFGLCVLIVLWVTIGLLTWNYLQHRKVRITGTAISVKLPQCDKPGQTMTSDGHGGLKCADGKSTNGPILYDHSKDSLIQSGDASATGDNSVADTGSDNTIIVRDSDEQEEPGTVISGGVNQPPMVVGADGKAYPITETDKSPSCMCNPDALSRAVLDRIYDTGFNHDPDSVDGFKEEQRQLNRLRTFSSKLMDTCLKAKYENWIRYYQNSHDEDLAKLLHPQADTQTQKEDAIDREVEKCKRDGVVPKIPSGVL